MALSVAYSFTLIPKRKNILLKNKANALNFILMPTLPINCHLQKLVAMYLQEIIHNFVIFRKQTEEKK